MLLSCLIRSLLKVKTQLNFFSNLNKFTRICINPGGFIQRKVLSVESFCCVGFFFVFVQFVYKLAQPLIKRHLPYMKRFFKEWTVNFKGLKNYYHPNSYYSNHCLYFHNYHYYHNYQIIFNDGQSCSTQPHACLRAISSRSLGDWHWGLRNEFLISLPGFCGRVSHLQTFQLWLMLIISQLGQLEYGSRWQ